METASFQFILFGLAVALLSNVNSSPRWRSGVMLLGSTVFLGLLAHSPLEFLPLAGFMMLTYVGVLLLARGWSRSFVWSVLSVILSYVWLKKYTFLPQASLLRFPYFTLGLSYIFFRVMHLLIESRDPERQGAVGFGAYLCYTLNFTTLVSGPIQRYEDFARDQFALEPVGLGLPVIAAQCERLVRGLFKVNVLAMVFQLVQEDALAQLSHSVPIEAKCLAAFRLAAIYPLFLYANFSGYIDIVIALARLMRIRLPENFDRPFSASSFLDFWNRWHITLSTWLRTYVYFPLLLTLTRRKFRPSLQPFLGVFCFFVTFFLVGIWHGRNSEFVVFGVLQGGGVAINKLWQLELTRAMTRQGYKTLSSSAAYIAFGRGLTYSWFAFTLFWFWASWQQIGAVFSSLGLFVWLGIWLSLWFTATVVLASWEWLREVLLSVKTRQGPVITSRYSRVVFASAMGLAAFVIMGLLSLSAPDLVYKAF